jgi:hypothetical protein
MEPVIIYLTKIPILTSFKPVRRIELLRSGAFDYHSETFVCSPVWEGGDLYPIDDENWDKYQDCVKNNKNIEWILSDIIY